MLRDDVLLLLTEAEGYLSGEEMREKLGVSRAAVSQAVRALRADGYDIDAVTNRGYCLRARPDTLTAGDVLSYLPEARRATVQCFAQIDSTNSYLKAAAMRGAPDGLCAIADVALVGFPSAGKSSLIAAMSSAKPKIADYPFTTLVPNLGVVVAGDMRYTIADVPGLIPGASQGKGLGLEFLRHIERTEIIAHVIDCATLEPGRDPMSDYQALEHELAEYAGKLELPLGAIPIPERPRIIILNKVDVPEAKELAEFVKPEFEKLGLKVYIISTASHEGLKELNWALADLVTNMRAEVAKREQAEEEARVVIKPLEEPRNRRRRNDEGGNALDFTVERKENGNGEVWYEVLGTKPERWVMQTNFDNDEAVGYLADRLAKLGVEDELRHKGAKPGDEVRIGRGDRAVEFDWDPTIAAGAEMLDGTQLGARGVDLRLQESDGRAQRRSNTERRRQYHEMMDARQAVREAMMAERKAGHWADPSVDDDRHDETSLFGRGETADDEDVEQ